MQQTELMQVLNDPIAQELIKSPIPARMAYTGVDGFPRAIPIGFHWDGKRFIVCTVPHSPKVRALSRDPHVALTIDTVDFPPHVLLVRGTASIETVDGVPREYLEAARKQVGDAGLPSFEAEVRGLYQHMSRITIVPTWAKVLDFETRLPRPVNELLERKAAASA